MRRLWTGAAALALLLGIGLVGSVVAVGLMLARPSRAAVGPPPATLSGAEAIAFNSRSGAVLKGWWLVPARSGSGVVLLMHGVGANRSSMVARAAVLHDAGFGVLLFDFQAHGESTGTHKTFGKLEAMDAAAALAFVRSRFPDERVGAIGVSLGGAAALLGPEPLKIDALVLESVYPDIGAALVSRLRVHLGPVGSVAAPVLSVLFQAALPPLIGVGPEELRPIDRIGRLQVPVLVASGMADSFTPIGEAEALFAAAPQPKRFWAVPGAGHVDLERFDQAAYWAAVMPVLAGLQR